MHSMETLAKHLMVIQILRGLVGEGLIGFLMSLWKSWNSGQERFSRKKVDTYI